MKILNKIKTFFKKEPKNDWEDGTFNGRKAQYNFKTNQMRFVFWKAGENFHTEDFWLTADRSWNSEFRNLNNLTVEEISKRNEYD